MTRLKTILAIMILCLLLMASASSAQAAGPSSEIIVSAAASLTNAFDAVKKGFEASHPGVRVVSNYAASGVLLRQMESGAPVDVFASADQKTMDEAAAKGLIAPATRRDFAKNGMVLVVPADSKLALKNERDLALPMVTRIALGNPETVPAGRYARECLDLAGLWAALTPKYILGNNVRQVLDYVARGEVDAAFIFATDAQQAEPKVRVLREVKTRTPALYPVAVAATSNKPIAKAFVDFLLSAEGQRILAKHGFKKS